MKLRLFLLVPSLASALVLGGCPNFGCQPRRPPDLEFDSAQALETADVVTQWNETILSIARVEDQFLTLKGVHTAAMAHLAMHDALNSLTPRYATYLEPVPDAAGDPLAAVAQAAYRVAVDQYPDHAVTFGHQRSRWIDPVSSAVDRAHVEAGLAVGEEAARRVLEARAGDGWDNEAEYRWHPMAPGVYAEFAEHSGTPEGFVFGAGWATARPFVLDGPDHFVSPPPPAIDSDEYTAAFDEVKSVGAFESATRTADQSHLALWWKEFVESSHSRLARELALEEHIDAWQASRLFALLEASIFDAYVDVFHNKFLHNHWRPYTAIRWAEHDGNPETEADPEWNNHHRHTYAFPSYPSAHGTACAAAQTVLAEVFGAERAVSMTIPVVDSAGPFSDKIQMDPPTRTFDSFADAAMECSMSRVYLGIHFRYDSVEGNALGRKIGNFVVADTLRPLPGD